MTSSLLNHLTNTPRVRVSTKGYMKEETLGPGEEQPRHPGEEQPRPSEGQPRPSDAVTLDHIANFMELDLRRILTWLNAGRKTTLALAVIGAIAAFSWGHLVAPSYTVTTDILVDPTNLQVIRDDPFAAPSGNNSQLFDFGSRVRMLDSGNVLLRAVKELDLAKDPEFYKPSSPGLLAFLRAKPADKPDPDAGALKSLQKQVSITTDEKSFIASLHVSAQTSDKAVAISNAVVDAFRVELAAGDSQNAARTAAALDDRLGKLKRDVLAADASVEEYRRKHSLLAGENGQLVKAQTVNELNTEIISARSRVINAQVSYDALLKAGDAPLGSQSAGSPALAAMLQTAGVLQQQYDDQSSVLGARHPSMVRLQARLSSIRSQIRDELERARSTAKDELSKAHAALDELTARMQEVEGSTFDDNQSQIELRELQRDATAKAQVYESFLTRMRQILEREQINTNNIRVISEPMPPAGRSWPPGSVLLLLLGGIVGFIFGIILSIVSGVVSDIRSAPRSATRVQ